MGNDNPMIGGLVNFNFVRNIEEIPSALNSSKNNFKETISKAEIIFNEYEKDKTLKNLIELAKKFL